MQKDVMSGLRNSSNHFDTKFGPLNLIHAPSPVQKEDIMTVFGNGLFLRRFLETLFRTVLFAYFPRSFFKNGRKSSVVISTFCNSAYIYRFKYKMKNYQYQTRKNEQTKIILEFEHIE